MMVLGRTPALDLSRMDGDQGAVTSHNPLENRSGRPESSR